MSGQLTNKIDTALGINVDQIIKDAELTIPDDSKDVEKFNERKQQLETFKKNLKDARNLKNKDWCEALLKVSADNMMIAQEIFKGEIEDNPAAKNVEAFGTLGNALKDTIKEVIELDREEERIAISKEKNLLRKAELEGGRGPILNAEGSTVIQGSINDVLLLMKNNVNPLENISNSSKE